MCQAGGYAVWFLLEHLCARPGLGHIQHQVIVLYHAGYRKSNVILQIHATEFLEKQNVANHSTQLWTDI